jgi:hypothetical protein
MNLGVCAGEKKKFAEGANKLYKNRLKVCVLIEMGGILACAKINQSIFTSLTSLTTSPIHTRLCERLFGPVLAIYYL